MEDNHGFAYRRLALISGSKYFKLQDMYVSNFDNNTTEFCQYNIMLMLYNEEQGRLQQVNTRALIPHLSYIDLKIWLLFWVLYCEIVLKEWMHETRLPEGKHGQNTAILVTQVLCVMFCDIHLLLITVPPTTHAVFLALSNPFRLTTVQFLYFQKYREFLFSYWSWNDVQWIVGMMTQEAPKILPIVLYSSIHFWPGSSIPKLMWFKLILLCDFYVFCVVVL